MATLYVENVPDDLYEALRERAKRNRRSMAAEVISLLEHEVPSPAQLAHRREVARRMEQLRSVGSPGSAPFPSAEEMQREARDERCER
jgi:plasmid stability protein